MKRRERLHYLIDELPESELQTAERFLDFLVIARAPLHRVLENAPTEDEEITPEEEAAIDEAWADIAAGRVISDAEVWRGSGHGSKD